MGQGNDLVLIGVLGCIALIFFTVLISILVITMLRKNLAAYLSSRFGDLLNRTRKIMRNFTRQNNGNDLRPVDVEITEENLALLKRIYVLEEEITTIKSFLQKSPPTLWERTQRAFSYFSIYWGFLSFLGSIILLIYIQLAFGVDYFESFRDISTEKTLSDFYRIQGDFMLGNLELPAAKGAYKRALEIDSNNVIAFYGLAGTEVFDVEEGQKYLDIQLAQRKLDYLLSNRPEDYHLYILKATLYDVVRDYETAQSWALKAIDINPELAAGYVMLGYIEQKTDIEDSFKNYQLAVQKEPANVAANNNLGYMYLLQNDYKNAEKYLGTAYYFSPKWNTLVNLGDVALFSKDYDNAKFRFSAALKTLEEPDLKPTESFLGGNIIFSYMPLKDGDLETIKRFEIFSTIDDKKSMMYYDLSFVFALTGDYEKANELFNTANALDTLQIHNPYFASKMISIENLLSVGPRMKSWIDEHIAILNQTH